MTIRTALSQPIQIPFADSWLRIKQWFWNELLNIVPNRLLSLGWRPALRTADAKPSPPDGQEIIEHSFFGIRRQTASKFNEPLPLSVELNEPEIFITTVSLPKIARNKIQNAIRLRLDDISPIPPHESNFAYRVRDQKQSTRMTVDVALAKAKTLQKLEKQFAGNKIGEVGARRRQDGELSFRFQQFKAAADNRLRVAVSFGLLLFASIIAISLASSVATERRIAGLSEYEDTLLEELKALQKIEAELGQITSQVSARPAHQALKSLSTAMNAIPDGIVIDAATFNQQGVTIQAIAPEGVAPSSNGLTITDRMNSDHPGYEHVNLLWSAEE